MFEKNNQVAVRIEVSITNGPVHLELRKFNSADGGLFRMVLRTPSGRSVTLNDTDWFGRDPQESAEFIFENDLRFIQQVFETTRQLFRIPDAGWEARSLKHALAQEFPDNFISAELIKAVLEFLCAESFIQVIQYHPNMEYRHAVYDYDTH
mgnify:CR=1 FL=1